MAEKDLFSRVFALPRELQVLILEQVDRAILSRLCQASRATYEMAWPVLWRNIDFVNVYDVNGELESSGILRGRQSQFFAACNLMIINQPDRWRVVAANVASLLMGRSYRQNKCYVLESEWRKMGYCLSDYEFIALRIISEFSNLRELSLFIVYDCLGGGYSRDVDWRRNMNNVRTLKIGGEIAKSMILLLLHRPDMLEELSLINIVQIRWQPSITVAPLLFLKPLAECFTRLRTLHLSKFVGQDMMKEYENLEEWASLLCGVSSTLVHLKLEMCYVQPHRGGPDDILDGLYKVSADQFRRVIRPVLLTRRWKKLERLTLIGLYHAMEPLEKLRGVSGGVKVEYFHGHRVWEDLKPDLPGIPPPKGVFCDSYLTITDDGNDGNESAV